MKRNALSLVCSLCFCFVFFGAAQIKAQDLKEAIRNQYQELDYILNVLRDNRASGEFELSVEQSRLVGRLKSRLEDHYRQYEENVRGSRGDIETTVPVKTEVYEKRFTEDLKMIQEELKSNVLLPHQVELLGKFQQKILFGWHLRNNFRQIKGTRFEGLNFSDQQIKKIAEIKQLFNDEYAEELKRFETTVEEMREELTAQIHDEMTDEQRELLNIK